MLLSLKDDASPALVAFSDRLKAFEKAIAASSSTLKNLSSSSTPAAAGVEKVSKSFFDASVSATLFTTRAQQALRALNDLAGHSRSAAQDVNELKSSLNSAGAAVGSMEKGATRASVAASAFGSGMRAASGEVSSFGQGTALASGHADSLGKRLLTGSEHADDFNDKLGALGRTIRVVGELWAAAKIGHGLSDAAEKAIKYEGTQLRLGHMRLGDEDNAMLKGEAERISREMPQLDQNKLLEMGQDLVNVTGSAKEAAEQLKKFANAAYAIKMADPSGELKERDIIQIAKAVELRGAGMDSERMDAEMNKFLQIIAATQGRVGTGQLLGNIKYAKGGLGNSMDIEFLPYFASMIEMVQSAGGNGGQVGVMLATLQKTVQNGPEKGRRDNWANNGLLDKDGRVIGADDFSKNPFKWAQEVLKPALERVGVDMADTARVNMILNSLSSNRNTVEGMSMMLTRGEQIEKDGKLINNTANIDQQIEKNLESTKSKIDGLKGSIDNLKMTIGEQITPAIAKMAELLGDAFNGINDFFKNNQFSAMGAVIVAAFTAASLAVLAFSHTLMMIIPASSMAAGGVVANLATITARAGVIGLAAAGAFTAGFVFFNAIKNFEVFGDTIENKAARSVANLISIYARFQKFLSDVVLGGVSNLLMAQGSVLSQIPGMSGLAGKLNSGAYEIKGWQAKIDGAAASAVDWAKTYGQKRAPLPPAPADTSANYTPGGVDYGSEKTDWDGKKVKDGFRMGKNPKEDGEDGQGSAGRAARQQARVDGESARLERELAAIKLKELEALYREHKIGVVEMYAAKTKAVEDGTAAQVAALERERASLAKDPEKNAGQIAKVETDIIIALAQKQSQLAQLNLQKTNELERIRLDGLKNAADLEAIQQTGTKSRIKLIEEEYEAKKKVFLINGETARAAEVEDRKQMAMAKARLDFERQQLDRKRSGIALNAESLKNAQNAGALTTLEAQQRALDLRMEEGQIIDGIVERLERMAEVSKDPALVDQIRKLKIEAEGLKYQFDEVTKAVRGGFSSGIEDALSALQGGKGLRAALRSLEQGILAPINAMVNKSVSEMLTNKLFGQADGTGAGTGFLGKIGQQLFGSGAAGAGVSKFAEKSGQSPADLANNALSKLASDGAAASTTALVENATKSTLGATAQSMATVALQSLTTAAQTAAMALQSMSGGSGGGGGILGSLFGGGDSASIGMDGAGDGFTSFFAGLPSFDVGADSLPRDMIAKIHKDEMILPAATAAKVRAGLSSGKGGAGLTVNNHFNVSGQTSRDTMNQMGAKAADALARAQRRNG